MKFLKLLLLFLVSPVAVAQVTLTHVHGLAYSEDGKRLMIPSHHGLAVHENGKWSKAPGPQHDYMGFVATAGRLYSSGHPAPKSGLVNPFGLIRSRDGGKTWEKLGLEGETDFHVLGASWNTHAIYVWNPAPSSRMREPGLHSTRDEGKTWRKARAAGVGGDPMSIAVHPDDPALVTLGTTEGVFESADGGESFREIAGRGAGTAVFYDLDGKLVWFATYDGKAPRLARARVRGGPPAQIQLPPLPKDAVSYLAQNPANRSEYAMATFERSVFVSPDAGRTWRQIARAGKGLSLMSADPAGLLANEGEVMAIYRQSGEIAIRHGPLPELSMDPMSMVFVVADTSMLDRVRKGDRVRFRAGLVNGRFGVLAIDRIKK